MPFGSNIVTPTHLLLVLLVVMLVFGTKKLPELGRGMGSAMREFKDGISGSPSAPQELEPPVRATEASQIDAERAVSVRHPTPLS